MVGCVTKLDFNTESGSRGRFARMAVFINLEKPLVSQIMVNGVVQRVEYENLPMVCFSWGHYGHIKEICPKIVGIPNVATISSMLCIMRRTFQKILALTVHG